MHQHAKILSYLYDSPQLKLGFQSALFGVILPGYSPELLDPRQDVAQGSVDKRKQILASSLHGIGHGSGYQSVCLAKVYKGK